jgi:hypothetical protein
VADPADRRERGATRYVLDRGLAGLAWPALRTLGRRPRRFAAGLRLALAMARGSDRPLPYHLVYLLEAAFQAGLGHVGEAAARPLATFLEVAPFLVLFLQMLLGLAMVLGVMEAAQRTLAFTNKQLRDAQRERALRKLRKVCAQRGLTWEAISQPLP